MVNSFSVFVGSTFTDLEKHRRAVREAIHRLEGVVRGMEYFGSLPGTPKEECLRIVRSCRLYVGIFAMRYGTIDLDTGKSLTHLEYEEAQRLSLPSLIYLLDEDRHPVLPKHVDFGEGADKLRKLKEHLKKRHVVSFFTSPDDLAMRVTQDLARLAQQGGVEVHRGELVKIVESLSCAPWPDDEVFAFIKEKIGELANPIRSDNILREALQYLFAGDRLAAAFFLVRSTELTLRQATELLKRINHVVMSIALEGYRRMEREGRVSAEFVQAFEQQVSNESLKLTGQSASD